MHRIDGPGATVDHKFTEGNPATSVAATTVTDDWLNALQEEVAAVVEDGGGVLDKNNNAQLLAKIKALISAAIPSNVPQGIRGAAANLKLSTTGLSSVVSITADELTVENNSSVFRTLGAVAVSPSFATAGANGLDAGAANSQTASTWYSVWVIWNGTTVAGLLSLSATAPTMPSGYTHKAWVGAVRTDATANKFPLAITQVGKVVKQKVVAGSNTPNQSVVASGAAGSTTTPTYTTIALGNYIPPMAAVVIGSVTQTAGLANAVAILAPNANYGPANSTTNPAAVQNNGSSNSTISVPYRFVLETFNLYYAANLAPFIVTVDGWEYS